MKKLKHEAELVKGAILAGMKYGVVRGAVVFEPTDSASEKIRFIYRLLIRFEASTFSGDIKSDFEMATEDLRESGKELRGVVNGGGATVKLSSFSGDIKLKKV